MWKREDGEKSGAAMPLGIYMYIYLWRKVRNTDFFASGRNWHPTTFKENISLFSRKKKREKDEEMVIYIRKC